MQTFLMSEKNAALPQVFMMNATVVPNSCDIICKAANEGATFLNSSITIWTRFRNIYIGVNNDSSGLTGKIVARINKYYPCVHLINTDPDNANMEATVHIVACLRKSPKHPIQATALWSMLMKLDSSIATSFHLRFISSEKSFDILSLNWINLCGGERFAKPMEIDS